MDERPKQPSRALTLTERVLFERLGWFVGVRWVAGLAAMVFMALGWFVFDVRFEVIAAVVVVFAMFFLNALFSLCARVSWSIAKTASSVSASQTRCRSMTSLMTTEISTKPIR